MKTCVSIVNIKDLNKANKSKADFLELRTDLYEDYDLEELVDKCEKPVIVKVATRRDLQISLALKPKYIDVDYKMSDLDKLDYKQQKYIISYHNFKLTPDFKYLDKLVTQGVNKIAVKINKVEDNLVIAKLLYKYANKIIAIGMGELGVMTRLDNRNKISYFALDKNKNSAPGQLTLDQKDIKLYGIIGNPAKHSLSPKMHNQKFKKNKINALYQIWETESLNKMIQIFKEFNLSGASITVPYKEEVIKYLDSTDKIVKKIGAANTIVNINNKLFGYNTDWYGVVKAICNCKSLKNKKAVILGRGGAAKAAKYGLEKYGAEVVMLGRRDMEKFKQKFDILIDATPVHDKLLISADLINCKTIILDMVYYKQTELLKTARRKKAVSMDGLPMLKYQGELQFYYWTNIREDFKNIKL